MSGRGSKVSSDSPTSSGNQKYMCSSLSVKCRRPEVPRPADAMEAGEPGSSACSAAEAWSRARLAAPASRPAASKSRMVMGLGFGRSPACSTSSGSSSTLPIAPSASFIAQNRRNAMAFSATSSEWGLFVNAMRQLTQSVKVVTSVSVMCAKCSRTIFSIVSKDSRTIVCASSWAAVVNTMNMLFQPDFTLATRAKTIWLTQRMISSRISTLWLCLITTTKGRRNSF
mmetsp:Transcript_24653/g.62011  ORF Transcript_24653/g.62011 Transcript_24653/m.62011 type:complete len:227 (-) Transcript_24653:2313-2993(-)